MPKPNLVATAFLGSVLKQNQGSCWVHCEIKLEKLLGPFSVPAIEVCQATKGVRRRENGKKRGSFE